MTKKRSSTSKKPQPQRTLTNPTWLKTLHEQGILGILLLALAIITLAGLFNRASGTLIDPWSNLIHQLLGWGSYPAVLVVIVVSVMLILGKMPDRSSIPWHIIVGIEIIFFVLLGLTHLLFARDAPWQAAQEGLGGGYVGAVFSGILSELLGPLATGVILGCALVGGIVITSGWSVQDWLEQIDDWAFELVEKGREMLLPPGREQADVGQEAISERVTTSQSVQQLSPDAVSVAAPVAVAVPVVAQPEPKRKRARHYQVTLPPLTLLDEPSPTKSDMDDAQNKARIIEETLAHFDVPAKVVETNWGPRVTQFGVEPGYVTRIGQGGEETERKIRVSKIASLNKDLALALAASPIRIEAPVPGRAIVGIEVPNDSLSIVSLRQVMESRVFRRKKSALKLGLGTGTAGYAVVADLAKMPHLLIAGATGAGKSACINAIAASLLFQNSPLTLRLVMIDPKRVELTSYEGLPHLYGRVEVDVERVVSVLQWLVNEMQARYQKLADVGARHIDEYNKKWQVGSSEYMPRVVVLIDELADLMFFAPDEVEKSICRLAQMARATGMHLVLATQRPSVDVVTGLIKA
ncbi:MAG: DNA translocase FtsK 4TM domain-containing protein, partial [Anaerolineae bacterium]|nr:DNA translocase FtsK 4TM domain-containing protein [Anaerolineae bacterium]